MCQIHSAVYVALQTMYRLLQVVMGLSLGLARAQPGPVQFLGLRLYNLPGYLKSEDICKAILHFLGVHHCLSRSYVLVR